MASINSSGNRVISPTSGETTTLTVTNTSNTANSQALYQATVAGTSAGDAFSTYTITGTQSWSHGVDNSASDAFVISASTALGTTNVMSIATAGEINYPLQSSFSAYLSASDLDATGDGTTFTIGTGNAFTELWDQNADFNTNGTYTAPITGRIFFSVGIQATQITAGMTTGVFSCVTSNRTWRLWAGNPGAVMTVTTTSQYSTNIFADMDAGDTATITIQYSNGTKVADIGAGSAPATWFAGQLLA